MRTLCILTGIFSFRNAIVQYEMHGSSPVFLYRGGGGVDDRKGRHNGKCILGNCGLSSWQARVENRWG
jgi:hypothetical protein